MCFADAADAMRVGTLLVLSRLLIAQLSSVPLGLTVLLVLPAAAGAAEACDGDTCPVPAGAPGADNDDFVVLNEDDSPLDDDEDELLEPSPEAKAAAAAAQKGEAAATSAGSLSETAAAGAGMEDDESLATAEAEGEDEEAEEGEEGEVVSSFDADGDAAWQKATARKTAREAAPKAEGTADGSAPAADGTEASGAAATDIAAADTAGADTGAADTGASGTGVAGAGTAEQHASPEAAAQPDGNAAGGAPRSKLSQSKVVSGAAVEAAASPTPTDAAGATPTPASVAGEAADASANVKAAATANAATRGAATPAAAADSPPPASGSSAGEGSRPGYTTADLDADLAIIQITAQMGLVKQLLDGIANVTFGLGDTNGDGALTHAEVEGFAARHLREGTPIGRTLGLSGGVLPVDDSAAVRGVVQKVFAVCDVDKDGTITRDEARADSCMRVVLGLLEAIPEPQAAEAERTAGAGSQQTGLSELEELMKEAMGAAGRAASGAGARGGAAGSVGGGGTPARRLGPAAGVAQALVPLRRYGLKLLATARANLGKPNLNTGLTGVGLGCLMLREMLRHDLFSSREVLGGVIGGPLPQFLARLRNLAFAAIAVGALWKFE